MRRTPVGIYGLIAVLSCVAALPPRDLMGAAAPTTSPASTASAPSTISAVRTWNDLEAVAAQDAGGGWSVRLGYADLGPDSGASWIVLYCLATSASPDARLGGDSHGQ